MDVNAIYATRQIRDGQVILQKGHMRNWNVCQVNMRTSTLCIFLMDSEKPCFNKLLHMCYYLEIQTKQNYKRSLKLHRYTLKIKTLIFCMNSQFI